jgi:thioesterase domain-containing protein
MAPDILESYLHEHIPLSYHLGLQVLEAGAESVRLRAPLGPNLNHRQTAFGGSISALAILSGWSLLWVRLRNVTEGHRIVIHSSALSYLAPVRSDFEALCLAPSAETWDAFTRTFATRDRARIELQATVTADGETVARFQGRYVVFLPGAFA